MSELHSLMEQYGGNMDRKGELDQLLFVGEDKEQWIHNLKKRGVELKHLGEENARIRARIFELLEQDWDGDTAALWYEEAQKMYWEDHDDYSLLLPVFFKLLDYYEPGGDKDRLIFLNSAIFYEITEKERRSMGGEALQLHYVERVISLGRDYVNLSKKSRELLWKAYLNAFVIGLEAGALNVNEAYVLYEKMDALWQSKEVRELDGQDPFFVELLAHIHREFFSSEEFMDEADEKTKETFCREAKAHYREELLSRSDLMVDCGCDIYAAYLRSMVMQGEKTFDEIIELLLKPYLEYARQTSDIGKCDEERLNFIINVPFILERWSKRMSSAKRRQEIMEQLQHVTQRLWFEQLGEMDDPFVNEQLAKWCHIMLHYIPRVDEKENWIFQLVVRRQLPTYLHSVMVSELAEAFGKEIMRQIPDFFNPVIGLRGGSIISFLRSSALMHDVGKIRITDVINNQSRGLTEREFGAIRRHPDFGAEMLGSFPDLSCYRDIALGHHRYFDGSGGYPETFDNLHSPYRSVIDVMTICDSIDAATDSLGRNYKQPKTFVQVLEELVRERGIRYNPQLVDVILHSHRLQKEMAYITSEGRQEIMYRAFLQSVF